MKNRKLSDFLGFMQKRLNASTDFVEVNFESLQKISVESAPASIYPPSGILIQGVNEVKRFQRQRCRRFSARRKKLI